MSCVSKLKILLGLDSSAETYLGTIEEMVEAEFKDYCNRDDIPASAEGLILKMCLAQYNRVKAQGITSQTFSGISESFNDGYTADIISALNRYRKVKMI